MRNVQKEFALALDHKKSFLILLVEKYQKGEEDTQGKTGHQKVDVQWERRREKRRDKRSQVQL